MSRHGCPKWGYTRIKGVLKNFNIKIGRSTIARILAEQGIYPAPERGKKTSWHVFIKSHFGSIAAMDFFNVEVLTWFGLVRYYVLFIIDIETRRDIREWPIPYIRGGGKSRPKRVNWDLLPSIFSAPFAMRRRGSSLRNIISSSASEEVIIVTEGGWRLSR